ncbi:MAG: LacI family DNA-binding transcriptional regulator [Cellulosilyticaceae bacterium]
MGKKKITMADIANQLSISIVSVSKALSNKEGVSDSLRQEILETAVKMGYTTPSLLQEKITPSTFNIGVMIAKRFLNTSNSFYLHVYQKLVTQFGKYNYSVILEVIDAPSESAGIPPNILENNKVDAVIILGQMSEPYLSAIKALEPCLLFLDFYNYHFDVDAIVTDNMFGAYTLTQHLIDLGHKKIGFVGNIHSTSSILDRYLGYYRCIIENNLSYNPNWLINDRDESGAYIPFEFPDDCPTAFICNCDEIAANFINTLRDLGLHIPNDISVTGFDNHISSNLFYPPLTTIEVDTHLMAKEAVSVILKKIATPTYRGDRKMLPCKFILGQSTKKLHS